MGARNCRGVDSRPPGVPRGRIPGPSFAVLASPSHSATCAVHSSLSLPGGACHSGITVSCTTGRDAAGSPRFEGPHSCSTSHSGRCPWRGACVRGRPVLRSTLAAFCLLVGVPGCGFTGLSGRRGACPQAKSASPAELCHSSLPSMRRSLLPAVLSSCLRELWHSFPDLQQ